MVCGDLCAVPLGRLLNGTVHVLLAVPPPVEAPIQAATSGVTGDRGNPYYAAELEKAGKKPVGE